MGHPNAACLVPDGPCRRSQEKLIPWPSKWVPYFLSLLRLRFCYLTSSQVRVLQHLRSGLSLGSPLIMIRMFCPLQPPVVCFGIRTLIQSSILPPSPRTPSPMSPGVVLLALEANPANIKPAICMTLAHLELNEAPAAPASTSAFFRSNPQTAAFTVPPSKPYNEELQKCWQEPKSLSHHTSDRRVLAAMQDVGSYGLDRMPVVKP